MSTAIVLVALAALLAPASRASWILASGIAPIAGEHAESLSVGAIYAGLPEIMDFLGKHPDRRLATWLIHPEDAVASFDSKLAVGALVTEALFPRPVDDVRTASPKPSDLVVMPHGVEVPWPHREALSNRFGRVLEALQ
ncbi:MAG: hypothetical protein ABL997_06670 [Planctomycetota bacterium]